MRSLLHALALSATADYSAPSDLHWLLLGHRTLDGGTVHIGEDYFGLDDDDASDRPAL